MNLDTLTLMVVGSFTTALSGILLIGSWMTTLNKERALAWWAAANLVYAAGIALIVLGTILHEAFVVAGVSLTSLSPALVWAGARQFEGRRQIWPALFAGVAVWFVASVTTNDGNGASAAGAFVALANWTVYLFAAVFELWRGRAEPLKARWPLVAMLTIHALVYIGGLSDIVTGSFAEDGAPSLDGWFSVIYFEGIIYAICTTLFILMLCKERGELGYIRAARNDSLTGVANRGTFLEGAERLLRRCQSDGASFSMIMFDLDKFKSINDTFGHAVGDTVLRSFANTTRSMLRPNDLFGRYGGEEFAVVLPGATIEAAYVIAERIRHKFAAIGLVLDDKPLAATVSAGVAAATSQTTVETILRAADESMYRAKRLGRNRVERAGHERLRDTDGDNVIRVA